MSLFIALQNYSAEGPSQLDDENVLCIIRDLVDNGGIAGKKTLNLQATVPARQAARDIARTCGYKEDSVSVHYEQQLGSDDVSLLVAKCLVQKKSMPLMIGRHYKSSAITCYSSFCDDHTRL